MSLGMAADKILPGYDVIDNNRIAEKAKNCIEREERPVEKKLLFPEIFLHLWYAHDKLIAFRG